MLGRIGFDGQLAHGAHFLLGRNRHAERRIGAEGLPILRGLAHVSVAEDHGDVFAVERAFQDTGFFAGIAEGIGKGGHGEEQRLEDG